MYKRLLAVVNEDVTSEVAARYGLFLAKATGASVYLSYIAERGTPERNFNFAQSAIKRLFYMAQDMGIPVDALLESGDWSKRIKEIVRERDIDIVFGATRRERQDSEYTLGPFAKTLLSVSCSVALVRVVHLGRLHPKRILIPLKDKIERIKERAYFSSMLCKAFDAEMILLHIKRPVKGILKGGLIVSPLEMEKYVSRDIETFIECAHREGIPVEKRLFHGLPERDITLEATSRRSDLIIMGFTERGFLKRFIEKSPLKQVLRKTPCNLIILKPSR